MRLSDIFVSYVLVTVLNLYCKLYHRIARYAHEVLYKIACNFKQKPPYSERLRCSIISSSAMWAGKIKAGAEVNMPSKSRKEKTANQKFFRCTQKTPFLRGF